MFSPFLEQQFEPMGTSALKFVEATSLVTVNGVIMIESECQMKTVVFNHGCPSQIITDNASYCMQRNFPKICKFWA